MAGIVRRRRSEARRLHGAGARSGAGPRGRGETAAPTAGARSGCSRGCSADATTALADDAEELAWSAPAPQPAALADLVTQVEREVNGA